MRKIISLLSAAAMAASLVPSVAMAEGDTVLYSNSFNGYPTSAKTEEGTVFAVQSGSDYTSVEGNPDWQWIFNSPASRTLDNLTVGFDGDRGDDTAAITINEKDETDKYLIMPQNRFQSRCKPQITGLDQYAADEGESLVISFSAKVTEGEKSTAALDLGAVGTITSDTLGTDEWKTVKLVVADSSTTIYVDGTQVGEVVSAVPSIIRPLPFDADTKCDNGVYATVCIDELVILSSADGAEATIPAAEDHSFDPEPEETDAPAAAEITDTVMIDFDTTDFEAAGVTVAKNDAYTTVEAAAVEGGVGDNTSIVYKVDQTSSKNTAYGYATFDFSALTSGKSHIVIDYDIYVGSNGRLKVIFADGALSGSNSDNLGSLFTQGITKRGEEAGVNCKTGAWVHTTVDVDLASGTGTYSVTGAEETVVGRGKITTDIKALTTMSLVSWDPNTSYVDNIAIGTGGEVEVVTPSPVPTLTPEAASSVEGTGTKADPAWTLAKGTSLDEDWTEAIEATAEILNHSEAKKAKSTANTAIGAYSDKARGNSIYAAYDVNLTPDSKISITPYGNKGDSQAATMTLSADATGAVTVSAVVSSSGSQPSAAEKLVHGTWYRVLVEVPQGGDATTTTTGNLTYTVYRIDSADPSKAAGVAAQLTGLSPRGLDKKGVTSFGTSVTGDVYIDNMASFVTSKEYSLIETVVTPEPAATPEPASEVEGSNIDLVAKDGRAVTDAFAEVNGTPETKLNHSEAKPAVAGTINAYHEKQKGNSTYVVYDVLVNAGDKLSLAEKNTNGDKLGATFVLTGNENGTATASYIDKGGNKGGTLSGSLVCGTWYRVVIETPVSSDGHCGKSVYTVYRIDPSDPSKTLEVAAKAKGIEARNLNDRGITSVDVTAEGTPYIDNGVVYINPNSTDTTTTWYKYSFTKDENGVLTSVTVTTVADPSAETIGDNEYLWDQDQTPYKND
ncbi:MAG: hypothetical protein IJH37_11165 [Clostridia bacterium]|nr:hypothetical protein [Clostridia bacterium]